MFFGIRGKSETGGNASLSQRVDASVRHNHIIIMNLFDYAILQILPWQLNDMHTI